uniref:Uncharacterized protein n=1 Tax=Oryza barthii TaxID=65489 RepID=A0A0D3F0Y7_9ORYZ
MAHSLMAVGPRRPDWAVGWPTCQARKRRHRCGWLPETSGAFPAAFFSSPIPFGIRFSVGNATAAESQGQRCSASPASSPPPPVAQSVSGVLSQSLVSPFDPRDPRVTDLKDALWSGSLTFQHALSTFAADENTSGRKFASYTVFKGKAALSMQPILPSFSKLESGGSRVNKNGSVMLTFFPAVGQRKYDYSKKQLFALSPTEVGSLISLGPAESCEFFHDPSMKSSHEGQVKKSLSVTPLGNDSGYFLNITVLNNLQKTTERLSLPISKAEFTVMRTALSFALPHILGWDQALTNHQPSPSPASKPRVERPHPDSEWER